MATERLFIEEDVQRLIDINVAPPRGRRNTALIMGGHVLGINPIRVIDAFSQECNR